MNRQEMVEGIMRQAGLTKANVARFYEGLVQLAHRELVRNKEFVLPGLGALRVRMRKARTGRNPRTGETIRIRARKVVRFRTYRTLDELLNGPRKAAPSEPKAAADTESTSLWPPSESLPTQPPETQPPEQPG